LKRKVFMVRADLAESISELASRRGTLFDFVNDVLEQALRAESMGLTLGEALDEMWTLKAAKESGFTFVPEKLMYDLVERAHKRLGEKAMEDLWFEAGQWYGRYYEDLEAFTKHIRGFFWDISELKASKEGKTLSLTCLCSKFSEAYTRLFGKFLEGALNVFGYELEQSDISKGIINLNCKESKGT